MRAVLQFSQSTQIELSELREVLSEYSVKLQELREVLSEYTNRTLRVERSTLKVERSTLGELSGTLRILSRTLESANTQPKKL